MLESDEGGVSTVYLICTCACKFMLGVYIYVCVAMGRASFLVYPRPVHARY